MKSHSALASTEALRKAAPNFVGVVGGTRLSKAEGVQQEWGKGQNPGGVGGLLETAENPILRLQRCWGCRWQHGPTWTEGQQVPTLLRSVKPD